MKIIKPILITSLVFNLFLSFLVIKFFLKENNIFKKEPELIKKITTSDIAEAKVQFNNIVQEKFPIGMSEIELIKKLSKQGFKPGWSYENEPSSAVFVNSNIICTSVWSVIWEVDELGNATKINGRYIAGCP